MACDGCCSVVDQPSVDRGLRVGGTVSTLRGSSETCAIYDMVWYMLNDFYAE